MDQFELLPGTVDALQLLQDEGYLLIIITNQSGISRGYYDENTFLKFQKNITDIFNNYGIDVHRVYYCPHTDEENCTCRKPKPGLFYKAAEEWNIDFSQSYAIGDNLRDLCICAFEKVEGILISNCINTSSTDVKQCLSLLEAAHVIANRQ